MATSMTGRRAPKTGREGRQAVVKVLIRAAILLVLGTLLTMTGTPVEVILAYYGLYFVLVLPLYRLGAGPPAALAVGTALVLPQVRFVVAGAAVRERAVSVAAWSICWSPAVILR
ncbi:hypothetical protein [Streptomyces sp. NPDC014733]|uniref:hypothetical protein n=1 Tax=Streptomyces sp. NPDC014733 TaxID=3364885 RepID=UPI0036FA5BA6